MSDLKEVDNPKAKELFKKLDELFIGEKVALTLNILMSYIGHSIVNQTNRNREECFKLILQIKIGLEKIVQSIIKSN